MVIQREYRLALLATKVVVAGVQSSKGIQAAVDPLQRWPLHHVRINK